MNIPFILFLISIAGMAGLFMFQRWQLKTGKVFIDDVDSEHENPLSQSNINLYSNVLRDRFDWWRRHVVLFVLKASIKVGYFVRMKLDAIVSKIHFIAVTEQKKIRAKTNQTEFLNKIGEVKEERREDK